MSGYSNNWSDESDFENEVGSQSGGGLRKLLEETLAENKRLRETFEGKEREKSATALLKDKGLDPGLSDLIPKDADPAEWVEKYAPLLGAKQVTPAFEEQPGTHPEMQHSDDDDPAIVARRAELAAEQKALADMQEAAEQGQPASVHDDLVSRMDKIESEDELLKFFRENGAPLD